MNFISNELYEKIILLTWKNPAFMAIAIASIWLIPQLFIRRIISDNYKKRELIKQKNKIDSLYPRKSNS